MKNTLLHDSFENRDGILHFGGANTVELAEQFGTPLYVYDRERIESNSDRLRKAFASRYEPFQLLYAVKADNNEEILEVVRDKTDGADASYSTEIELARGAGFPMISYSGNYASDEELKFGVQNADIVNLDSIESLPRILQYGIPQRLTFRINPGFGQGSFENNIFAGQQAKFGIPHEKAVKAYRAAKKAGVEHFGIYMMTGSCVLDPSYFAAITEKLLDVAGEIRKKLGIQFEWVNIGGGFGIPYRPNEKPLDIEKVAEKVTEMLRKKTKEHDLGQPTLMAEPGRYIVGDAGILLTTVHEVKKENYQPFAGTDAGMNVLIRPALYDAYHHILVAKRMNARPRSKITIVGQICENTDKIAKDRMMPALKRGDTLAILCTGAYGLSMSSQYNTRPRPAEILIENGEPRLIRERETLDDIRSKIPKKTTKK